MSDLFLAEIDIDGSNYQMLFEDIEGMPKYSRNGDKIIITSIREFWMCNSDGSEMICILDSLSNYENSFSISPIDDTIIFVDYLYLNKLNFITGEVEKLEPIVEGRIAHVSYSPDGLSIIFSTYFIEQPNNIYHNFIYKMDSNGLNVELVLQDEPGESRIEYPMFTTDMSKILFKKTYSGLFIINSDGTNYNNIVDGIMHTSISTGGDFVVFNLSTPMIEVYNIQTDEIYNLKEGNYPVISSDGSKVLYKKYDYDSNPNLYIIDIDGSNKRKLNEVQDKFFSFSADSEKVVFIKYHKYYVD